MKDIVLINESDYSTLISNGSFTKNGITHYYSDENLYIIDSIVNNVEHALTADYATTAGTATNAEYLVDRPLINEGEDDTNAITITAGGKTSDEFVVPYSRVANSASTANLASKVTVTTSTTNTPYNMVFHSSANQLYSNSALTFNPSTYSLTATHKNGGSNELRVVYSNTVDMALMVGSGNVNHGLYDNKASKWMIYADGSGNVIVNGNATTATNATDSTYATQLKTARTIWGQSFNGTGNVDGLLKITSPNSGNYTEGIRIKPSSLDWTTILLGGNDLSADTGTSAKSWSIHTNAGNFYINKNGANTAKATRLYGHNNGFTIGNTSTTTYNLNVAGTIYTATNMVATTTMNAGTSITAGTTVNAGTNVIAEGDVRAKGNDLYVGSASGSQCHQQYDASNKCLCFVFD